MKNKVLLSFGIILFALVIFLVPNSMAAVPANLTGDDIIPFEDEELKKYLISYNLDKNNDNEISVNEIKNFSELYITDIPKDLTPLIYANIFSVSISGENIKNLDFLADLTDISTIRKFSIYGSNCNIEDISGITNLKSLETVEIYYCSKITEIPNLSQLSNLNKIQIVGTPITNLDFLSQSKSLETLYIEKGKLNNIEGIRELVNLKEISFNENEISDISCLENLTNLTSLSLTANQIEDASIVSNLVNLQLLNLNKNKLTRIPDLSKITYFTNGKFGEYNNALIPFNDNQIVDISGLENTSFTGIDLSNNKIDDISILSTVSNLKYLNINNNNISDIQCLFGMKNLTSISANNNKITNVKVIDFKPEFDKWNNKINILLNNNLLESVTVSNLENCYSLELENNNLTNDKIIIENSTIFLVKLNRNKIEDINKIISSNNINYLMCAENKIKNIKVENNETITSLDLQKNQISTIPDLSELSKLETINLNYNNISDITPLLKNPSIKAAYLIGNKVNPHNESTFHVMCTFKEYNQYLMLGDCSQFENGELTTVETEKVEVNGEELDTMKIEKGTSKKISDFINEENFPVINTYTVKVLDASGNEKSEDQRVGSKNVIQITNEAGEKIAEYTVVVPGDVTGNGYSRMYDAFQILKDSLFNGNLDEIDMLIRDYDGNGYVRMYDAFQFLKDSLFN